MNQHQNKNFSLKLFIHLNYLFNDNYLFSEGKKYIMERFVNDDMASQKIEKNENQEEVKNDENKESEEHIEEIDNQSSPVPVEAIDEKKTEGQCLPWNEILNSRHTENVLFEQIATIMIPSCYRYATILIP